MYVLVPEPAQYLAGIIHGAGNGPRGYGVQTYPEKSRRKYPRNKPRRTYISFAGVVRSNIRLRLGPGRKPVRNVPGRLQIFVRLRTLEKDEYRISNIELRISK